MNKHSAPESVEGLLLRLHSEHFISGKEPNELYAQLRISHNGTTPAPEAYKLTGPQENPLTCAPLDTNPTIFTPAPSIASVNHAPVEIPIPDTKSHYQGLSSDTDKKANAKIKTKKGNGKGPKAGKQEKEVLSFDGLRMNGVSRADWRADTVEPKESHNVDAGVEFGVDDSIIDKSSGEPLGAVLITWYGHGRVCLRPYKGPLSG
jgi:hypothetical protein